LKNHLNSKKGNRFFLKFLYYIFFMNELIQSLQEKVGLTGDQAKDAINYIMDYIKSKVPASLHEHLDAAAIGDSLKTKSAELLAKAESGGGDLLRTVEEKLTGFLHSKEA
jgi:hypothetical protein